jgi:hypothetical protein
MPADFDPLLNVLEEERKLRADGRMAEPWAMVVSHLVAAPVEPAPARRHFNPRPPGVIRPNSSTERVLQYLRMRQGFAWSTYAQIVKATGCTAKSVDWALIYLRGLGLIEHAPHPGHEAYRRYRAVVADLAANECCPPNRRTSMTAKG